MENQTFAERYLDIANEKKSVEPPKIFKSWWQRMFEKISSNNTSILDPAFKKLIKNELAGFVAKGLLKEEEAASFWSLSDNELVKAYDEFQSTLG